jgi:hypothetical protein
MFPFLYEWNWDIGHYLFMGALGYASTVIGLGLAYAIGKSIYDIMRSDDNHSAH